MPRATDNEVQILGHIDLLTAVMADAARSGDGGAFLDALDESQAADRRLEESREHTWALWFAAATTERQEAA